MREYLLVFLVAAGVTYLLTVIAREIALRTGAIAMVRDRDVHEVPVPYLGGVAMLGGLWAGYLVATQLPFLSTQDPFIFDQARAVLLAGAFLCLVGVADDIWDLDALTKFGGQCLAAGLMAWQGVQYQWLPVSDGGVVSLDPAQGSLVTVVFVVTVINAVNFIDGLDGLAAGVIGVGAVSLFLFCYLLGVINNVSLAITGALLSACLAGVCAGFMPHNFHPARLFMGDSGSMLIGLVLAASTITLTGQFSTTDLVDSGTRAVLLPILAPLLICIVPLVDLLSAVVRRTRRGMSPFAPDKQHLHHRMLEFGHSHRRAVVLMWLWSGLLGMSIVMLSLYEGGPLMWFVFAGAALLVIALTFVVPRVPVPWK